MLYCPKAARDFNFALLDYLVEEELRFGGLYVVCLLCLGFLFVCVVCFCFRLLNSRLGFVPYQSLLICA